MDRGSRPQRHAPGPRLRVSVRSVPHLTPRLRSESRRLLRTGSPTPLAPTPLRLIQVHLKLRRVAQWPHHGPDGGVGLGLVGRHDRGPTQGRPQGARAHGQRQEGGPREAARRKYETKLTAGRRRWSSPGGFPDVNRRHFAEAPLCGCAYGGRLWAAGPPHIQKREMGHA